MRPDETRSRSRYTRSAVILHWLMAALILANFALGLAMVSIPGLTPAKLREVAYHKWIGVTLLALACLRLAWRLSHPAPPLPQTVPPWQRQAALALHAALYLLFFAVPVTGYLFSLASGVPVTYLGVLPLPVLIGPDPALKVVLRALHYWLNMGLAGCVVVHVLAALKHRFIDRDEVFQRMSL